MSPRTERCGTPSSHKLEVMGWQLLFPDISFLFCLPTDIPSTRSIVFCFPSFLQSFLPSVCGANRAATCCLDSLGQLKPGKDLSHLTAFPAVNVISHYSRHVDEDYGVLGRLPHAFLSDLAQGLVAALQLIKTGPVSFRWEKILVLLLM